MTLQDRWCYWKERWNLGSVWRGSSKYFKEKLGLENIGIERAHRSKGKTSSDKPWTIVCEPLSYKQKKEVLKNVKKLKDSNFFINEDFCFETMKRRKELWEEMKRLRSESQVAFLNYWSIVLKRRRDKGD